MSNSRISSPPSFDLSSNTSVDLVAKGYFLAAAEKLLKKYSLQELNELVWPDEKVHFLSENTHHLPVENEVASVNLGLLAAEAAISLAIKEIIQADSLAVLAARILELATHEILSFHDGLKLRVHLDSAKNHGYFFTPWPIALEMADELLDAGLPVKSVLDPACGSGILLHALLVRASQRNINVEKIIGIEKDAFSAHFAGKITMQVCKLLQVSVESKFIVGDSIELLHDRSQFDGISHVIMNPPYGRAKFHKDRLTNSETKRVANESTLENVAITRKLNAEILAGSLKTLSVKLGIDTGPQDFYRIFLALVLEILNGDGAAVIITPSGWLGDLNARKLRKKVLSGGGLKKIKIYSESLRLFRTVNQETVISSFRFNPKSESSSIDNQFILALSGFSQSDDSFVLDIKYLEEIDPVNLRIPRASLEAGLLYKKLSVNPSIKQAAWLINARGEVDLSLDKDLYSEKGNGPSLIRGDHIERYTLKGERAEFLTSDYAETKFPTRPKFKYLDSIRIACRQVSYIRKPRRLSWSVIPAGNALANSCNFLGIDLSTEKNLEFGDREGLEQDVIRGLLVVLNSLVIEWFFKFLNSNNHVANYEIAEFPLPPISELVGELCTVGKMLEDYYLQNPWADSSDPGLVEDLADLLVAKAFKLTSKELRIVALGIDPVRAPRLERMHQQLSQADIETLLKGGSWPNHVPPTLSELDMEMIRSVPQGGNWQDIPESVPSKRLEQIREMSKDRGIVRTTYYGRLRPDQPAYTISTYFNRPGNGTNIHPWEDRTLTSREAARLQSFPDWYLFLGNEGNIRNQIGNAVPPRLAFEIGKHLRTFVSEDSPVAVDLFAGAGGLSCGLEYAGWNVALAADIDKAAMKTYEINLPIQQSNVQNNFDTEIVVADFHKHSEIEETLSIIRKKLAGRRLNLLAGGPPCQGFSTAGWRAKSDERNNLAEIYLEFVRELDPDMVLLENVEGLLSYNKGQVLEDLQEVLRSLGYKLSTKPWVLAAEMYGVPQMRRRVILLGHKEHVVEGPMPSYQKCLGRRETPGDLKLFSEENPYPVTSGEALTGLSYFGGKSEPNLAATEALIGFQSWLAKGEN